MSHHSKIQIRFSLQLNSSCKIHRNVKTCYAIQGQKLNISLKNAKNLLVFLISLYFIRTKSYHWLRIISIFSLNDAVEFMYFEFNPLTPFRIKLKFRSKWDVLKSLLCFSEEALEWAKFWNFNSLRKLFPSENHLNVIHKSSSNSI